MNQAIKIYIACDHAGFNLKTNIISYLKNSNFKIIDLGCRSASVSVDYPDYAKKLAVKIKNKSDIGILICGSGIGISIAANRFKNIRAALCHNVKSAKFSRLHNDANVICLGARFIKEKTAITILKSFLSTNFEGNRHEKRVEKLSK
jgi:ribose 5-phosphate isomerase B